MSNRVITAAELRFRRDITNMSLPENITLSQTFDTSADYEIAFTDGIYNGLSISFELNITDSYPFAPPKVTCKCPIFHPNVCQKSRVVCMNLLRLEWRPTIDIESIIMCTLYMFLDDTIIDLEDALNTDAAEEYRRDKEQFIIKSRQSLINFTRPGHSQYLSRCT